MGRRGKRRAGGLWAMLCMGWGHVGMAWVAHAGESAYLRGDSSSLNVGGPEALLCTCVYMLCAYAVRICCAHMLCAYAVRICCAHMAHMLCAYAVRTCCAHMLCTYAVRICCAHMLCAYAVRICYAHMLCRHRGL